MYKIKISSTAGSCISRTFSVEKLSRIETKNNLIKVSAKYNVHYIEKLNIILDEVYNYL